MKPHEDTHKAPFEYALSPELTFETDYDDTVIATIVEEIVLEKFKDKLEELNRKVVRLRNKSGPAALGRGDSDPEPLLGSSNSPPTKNGGDGRKPEAEHVNVLNGVQVQVHVEGAPHENGTTTTNGEVLRTTPSTPSTAAPPEEVLFYEHKVTTTKYASSSSLERLELESESDNYGDKSKEIHRELQSTAVYLHDNRHQNERKDQHVDPEGEERLQLQQPSPFVVVHDSLNEYESTTVALNPNLHHEKSASPSPSPLSTTMVTSHSPSPKKEKSPKSPKEKTGYGLAPLSPIAAASVAGANQIFIRYRPKKLASLSSSAASFTDESMSLSKTPSPNRSPSPDPPPPYPYEEAEAQTPQPQPEQQPPSKLQRKTLTPSVSVEEIHKEIDRVIQQAEEINTALRGGDSHGHGVRAAPARRRSSSSDTMLDAYDSESVEVETVESETHEIDALEPDPDELQQQHGEVPLPEPQPTGGSTSSASATPPREKRTVEVIIRMVKVTTTKEETRLRDKKASREGSVHNGDSNGDGGDDDGDDGTSVDPPAPAQPSDSSSSTVQHPHDSAVPAPLYDPVAPPIMTGVKEPPPQPHESEPAPGAPLAVTVAAPATNGHPVSNRSDYIHEVRVVETEQVQFVMPISIQTPTPMPMAVSAPVDIMEPSEPETRVEALNRVGEHKVEHGPIEAPVVVQSRFVKKYAAVAAEVHTPKSEPPSVLMKAEQEEQSYGKVKEMIQTFQAQPLTKSPPPKENSPAISNGKNMKSATKPTTEDNDPTTTTGATKGLAKSAKGPCPEPTILAPKIKETPTPRLSQSPSKTEKKQPVEHKTPAQKEATSEVTVSQAKVPEPTPPTSTALAAPSVNVHASIPIPTPTSTPGTPKNKSKKKKGSNDTAHAAHDVDNNNHVEAKPAPKPNSTSPSPTKMVSPPSTSTSIPSSPSGVKKRTTDSNSNSKPKSPSTSPSSKGSHNSKSQSKNSTAVARGHGPVPLPVTGTLPVPTRGFLFALISDGLLLSIELILCLVFITVCFTYARGQRDLTPIGWLSLSVLLVASLISNTRLEDQLFNLIRRPGGGRGSRNSTWTWTSTLLLRWGTRTLHPLIWIGMLFKSARRYRLYPQDTAARSEFASVSHLYREHIAQDSIRLIVRFCVMMQVVGLSIYMCRSGHAVCYGPKAGDDGTLFSVQLATAFASGLAAARWTWRLLTL